MCYGALTLKHNLYGLRKGAALAQHSYGPKLPLFRPGGEGRIPPARTLDFYNLFNRRVKAIKLGIAKWHSKYFSIKFKVTIATTF